MMGAIPAVITTTNMRPRNKPKRNEDFLRWSDSELDLQNLLGDYTEVEANDWSSLSGSCNSSDDSSSDDNENQVAKSQIKSQPKTAQPKPKLRSTCQYECPCCSKILKSIAGFRGHCQRQHKVTGIKATDHRVDSGSAKHLGINTAATSQPVTPLDFDILTTKVDDCILRALDNLKMDPFLTLSCSAYGSKVIQVAELFKSHLVENNTAILTPITELLVPLVTKLGTGSTLQLDREHLYSDFHQLCTMSGLVSNLEVTLRSIVPDNLSDSINYMLQVMVNELLSELIAARTQMALRTSDEKNSEIGLTDVVQSTLMYVSGYIIHSLSRKHKRKAHVLDAVHCLIMDPSNTKSSRHRAWIERLDRGGLKHPTDELYNVVRQVEFLLQREVDFENLGPSTLAKDHLTELCLSDFSVQHHWELCATGLRGVISEQLLQDVVVTFLNIRGRAVGKKVARQINQDGQNKTGKKGIRKHLRPSIK